MNSINTNKVECKPYKEYYGNYGCKLNLCNLDLDLAINPFQSLCRIHEISLCTKINTSTEDIINIMKILYTTSKN